MQVAAAAFRATDAPGPCFQYAWDKNNNKKIKSHVHKKIPIILNAVMTASARERRRSDCELSIAEWDQTWCYWTELSFGFCQPLPLPLRYPNLAMCLTPRLMPVSTLPGGFLAFKSSVRAILNWHRWMAAEREYSISKEKHNVSEPDFPPPALTSNVPYWDSSAVWRLQDSQQITDIWSKTNCWIVRRVTTTRETHMMFDKSA